MATLASPVAPAAAAASLTLDQYLRTSYTPDCDFVEDHTEERLVGEYPHSKLQLLIGSWLLTHAREWRIDPVVEQRIRVSGDRVRIADICVLAADAPRENVTVTPPLLCIEILSPEDRIGRAKQVLADYLAMGVPQCWLIDPVRREAFTFDQQGLQTVDGDRLELPGTPIHVLLSELFAALD